MNAPAAAAAAEVPEEAVTIGAGTRWRSPLVWTLFTITAFGAFSAGVLVTHQDTSRGEVAEVKADVADMKAGVAAKASSDDLKAITAQVAAKADLADLKDLASKVVNKDVFDAVTSDLKNRIDGLGKSNEHLTSELADARRELSESTRRLEDLIRELAKHP
jgi:hypothetical protein